ncbi:MAG TPA: 4-(cytidine 5'-diphospho)-2-C-methyl-D-erythritol kinase [Flavobacteriales bacterium]|nr:4-(cytidine 5'-diphospho)-2-C-methyl-D-erythritol kinase [Flavobacteriales bacterium]
MIVFPNCKINLGLHITSKRSDGYHNIESVMVPVGWKDTLEVVGRGESISDSSILTGSAEVGKARFYSYGINIPGSAESNLCIQVYSLLEKWFNLPAVDIHLLKTIPIGAGLGGGSADAAFCLRALKSYFELRISDAEAKELLSGLGSDCPFFWDNKPAFAFGRGNELRPMEIDFRESWIALINPGIAISTQMAYAGVKPKPSSIDLTMLPDIPMEAWSEAIHNDFEDSVFPQFPIIGEMKARLYELGATYASLSGSGSTVFGIFDREPNLPKEWGEYSKWIGKL